MDRGAWQAAVQGAVESDNWACNIRHWRAWRLPTPSLPTLSKTSSRLLHSMVLMAQRHQRRARYSLLLTTALPLPHPLPTSNCHRLCALNKSLSSKGLSPCETAWDPLPQGLYLDIPLLEQQNTKKLYGTKNNCMHAQLRQILDKRHKETKKPNCFFQRGWSKSSISIPPKGWAKHLSHLSCQISGQPPTLTPYKKQAHPASGSE